jgi:hypothetical protein
LPKDPSAYVPVPDPGGESGPRAGAGFLARMVGEGMVGRRLIVRASDVVFVKGILEASEGLAQLFAEEGGDLTLAAPACREEELEGLVEDLVREVGAVRPTK